MASLLRYRIAAVAAVIALSAAINYAHAEPQRVSANLIASDVTVQNGIADSTFRIEIKNDDAVPLEDLLIVFADDVQLSVGTVPGEGSATSEEMTRSFDISESPSENTPISITLKFSVDGVQVEQQTNVVLKAGQ